MSDNWIGIIPRDPFFVPSDEAIAKAESFMNALAPEAWEINSKVTDTVRFRDCGANFESVCCPVCDAELSSEWWAKEMGDEYCWDQAFELHPVRLTCGHMVGSLNDLHYHWEQGFSRFILDVMNPGIYPLDASQVSHLEHILDCPIKVIYQHI